MEEMINVNEMFNQFWVWTVSLTASRSLYCTICSHHNCEAESDSHCEWGQLWLTDIRLIHSSSLGVAGLWIHFEYSFIKTNCIIRRSDPGLNYSLVLFVIVTAAESVNQTVGFFQAVQAVKGGRNDRGKEWIKIEAHGQEFGPERGSKSSQRWLTAC